MKQHQDEISVATKGRGLHDVTKKIDAVVRASGITTGLCTVFVQHMSASLVIQQSDLPFGGVGASGIGQYHGKEGFDAFTKKKPVFLPKPPGRHGAPPRCES